MKNSFSRLLGAAFLAASTLGGAATFDRANGVYEGKITMVGCHVMDQTTAQSDNQCYLQPEATSPAISEKTAGSPTCNSGLVRYWGKRAEGALTTSMITDAFLAGKTVRIYTTTACFDGFFNAPTFDSLSILN